MGGGVLIPEADSASSHRPPSNGHTVNQGPVGDHESTVYRDLAWLGTGLAVTAGAFVFTGSVVVQALVMLGYIGGASIGARHRQHVTMVTGAGRGYGARLVLCLVVAGLGVYLGTRHAVRLALGPWFAWWLAIGSGIVIFRHWQRRLEARSR
jgi:hypothetical protein